MSELGDYIRQARLDRGLTVRGLEELAEMRNGHLSQIENGGIAKPNFETLYRLAKALDREYQEVLVAAGYAGPQVDAARRSLHGIALRTMEKLTLQEQTDLQRHMEDMIRQRTAGDPAPG